MTKELGLNIIDSAIDIFNPHNKSILGLANEKVELFFDGFEKRFTKSSSKKKFTENYIKEKFKNKTSIKFDKYFQTGYELVKNQTDRNYRNYILLELFFRCKHEIPDCFEKYNESEFHLFTIDMHTSIQNVNNVVWGATFLLEIYRVTEYVNSIGIDIQYEEPNNFLSDEYIEENEKEEKYSLGNFDDLISIAEDVSEKLDKKIKEKLVDKITIPTNIRIAALEYYDEITFYDLSINLVKKWIADIEYRLSQSQNIEYLLNDELKKFDYLNKDFEYAIDYEKLKKVGYNFAIEGRNSSVGYYIQNNRINFNLYGTYTVNFETIRENSIHSYYSLLSIFRHISIITEGFSYAIITNLIRNHYITTYLNGVKSNYTLVDGMLIKNSLPTVNEIINDPTDTPPTGANVKLNWTGTPRELCYFISEFMTLGYIEEMQLTQTATILKKIFNIKQQDGKDVADRTLTDYLRHNKKSYPHAVMRIPQSENYGKE